MTEELRLAIDTGGTFTDCVLSDGSGSWFWKTLSTPEAPEESVLAGIVGLASQRRFELADVDTILLATTVATNAILERKGAATALVTTRGFRDVLLLGRAKRYDTFDMHLRRPVPLVARRNIVEVAERIGPDGAVIEPLRHDGLIQHLEALNPDAVAVSLLHAYANPVHEEAIAEHLARWRPELPVSLSSIVSPKYREYERTSTTVANAYVTPVANRFLGRLETAFTERGFSGSLYVMQSSGGLLSTELTRRLPVNIIESGPAAGVLLAAQIGQRERIGHVLSFDMGGTTAKLGAVEDGEPAVSATFEVDTVNQRPGSGLPLNIPAVELVEIGAGGGSIATVDLGLIRVGPESAGAEPGPVCYGRGGTCATITDANLVLGYLDASRFAGGRLSLDRDAAVAAIDAQVATPLGLSIEQAAWGVHALANASMERAMRSMSIERGRDPRDYALVAFGGAGPIHACRLARALGVRQVVVPDGAGVGSALGMLDADPTLTVSLTRHLTIDRAADASIRSCFERLEAIAALSGGGATDISQRHAYLRYAGQGYELRVEIPPGPIGTGYAADAAARFHAAYEAEYGYSEPDSTVEGIDWYLTVTLPGSVPTEAPVPGVAAVAGDDVALAGRQEAWFPDGIGSTDCPVYERTAIPVDAIVEGPAIVTDDEATTLIPPGDRARRNDAGHLVIDIAEEAS